MGNRSGRKNSSLSSPALLLLPKSSVSSFLIISTSLDKGPFTDHLLFLRQKQKSQDTVFTSDISICIYIHSDSVRLWCFLLRPWKLPLLQEE